MRFNKVFCIGFHKTGTTSLEHAWRRLGLRCKGYDPLLVERYEVGDYDYLFELTEHYDAFRDWPWPLMYRELDQRIENAGFILTTRNSAAWIDSLTRHADKVGPTKARWLVYGYEKPADNPIAHIETYNRHNNAALEYFDKRSNLLVLPLEAQPSFKLLCQFLEVPFVDEPYPVEYEDSRYNKNAFANVRIGSAINPTSQPMPFIVGANRSGTTLLRLMLDTHPLCAISPETHFISAIPEALCTADDDAEARRAFCELLVKSRAWNDFGIPAHDLTRSINAITDFTASAGLRCFYKLYADSMGKSRYGDKTAGYAFVIGKIASLLPEAQFIHIIRDGRDVALSNIEAGWASVDRISEAALKWSSAIRSARRQASSMRLRYIEIRYESLIADPETQIRKICSFVDLPYDPVMLSYHLTAQQRIARLPDIRGVDGNLRPAEMRHYRHRLTSKPPDSSRIGRWKSVLSSAAVQQFMQTAGNLLGELGYE